MQRAVVSVVVLVVVMGLPLTAAAQPDEQATTATSAATSTTTSQGGGKPSTAVDAQPNPRFVRTLTNVQLELTLTDQTGTGAPDKKTVSMVVSSGNWGKIRSAGSVRPIGDAPFGVDLNVDARPFVAVEGQIQLELTLNYSPLGSTAPGRDSATARTGLNQSLTVVLQNGKPLIISQSADPVSDRKVVVEVKATVLK